jgi:zinc transporter ZupT
MLSSPFAVGGLVFLLAFGAGALALAVRLSARALHGIVAAACGLFLGITFLHLLPEVAERAHEADGQRTLLWGSVLVGLLAVLLADVLLRSKEPDHDGDHPAHHGGHRVVGIATFVGLSLHTLGAAMGIGLGFEDPPLRNVMVAATLTHKAAEAFGLASVLLLAEFSRRAVLLLLLGYALVTPLGLLAGRALVGTLPASALGPAEGLAAGTFLYVAVGELLPEVFHGRADRGLKVLLLVAGIAATGLFELGSG